MPPAGWRRRHSQAHGGVRLRHATSRSSKKNPRKTKEKKGGLLEARTCHLRFDRALFRASDACAGSCPSKPNSTQDRSTRYLSPKPPSQGTGCQRGRSARDCRWARNRTPVRLPGLVRPRLTRSIAHGHRRGRRGVDHAHCRTNGRPNRAREHRKVRAAENERIWHRTAGGLEQRIEMVPRAAHRDRPLGLARRTGPSSANSRAHPDAIDDGFSIGTAAHRTFSADHRDVPGLCGDWV